MIWWKRFKFLQQKLFIEKGAAALSNKVFVTSDFSAVFFCPECTKSQRKNVSKFMGHKTKVKLKYKCACGHQFTVELDRRRYVRKGVKFKGFLFYDPEKIPIVIENFSKYGMRLKTAKMPSLKVGQVIRVSFTLDDPNRSTVEREVRIQELTPPAGITCEFLNSDHHGSLGKYFLFYFNSLND